MISPQQLSACEIGLNIELVFELEVIPSTLWNKGMAAEEEECAQSQKLWGHGTNHVKFLLTPVIHTRKAGHQV
jgi:hypothetical protein